MKKVLSAGLALLGSALIMVPSASALEHIAGGYWRTRAYVQSDFNGLTDNSAGDTEIVDTRTRLYYTAKFNEDFKFVNKFEFDTAWGDVSAGDLGADGNNFELKNSYVDFNLGSTNLKIGIQGSTIARGFMFAEDFSGMAVTFKAGDVSIPVTWIHAVDSDAKLQTNPTEDVFAITPVIPLNSDMTLNPYVALDYSDNLDKSIYFLGVDFDMKISGADVWASAIYQGGDVSNTVDTSAFLVAAGGSFDMFHGQLVYATGDDGNDATANDAFVGVDIGGKGQSYYWSEIMGYGIFDNASPSGTPNEKITNIMFANAGITIKASDAITFVADLWYAQLAEDNGLGDDDLGFEVDLKMTYKLTDNLNLDLVAAYLFAGDAITAHAYDGDNATETKNQENPFEAGTRLSFKF